MNFEPASPGQKLRIKADEWNQVRRAASLRLDQTVPKSGEPAELAPFEVYQHEAATPDPDTDWRTFVVHTGEVFNSSDASFDKFADNDDDAEEDPGILDIVVPADSTLYKVWLDIPVVVDSDAGTYTVTIDEEHRLKIDSGADGWGAWPDLWTEEHWYFLLAEITTTADSGDGSKVARIYQDVRDNIRLPFFVPDPSVDPNPVNGCLELLLVQ
jgi:hypothetical protein